MQTKNQSASPSTVVMQIDPRQQQDYIINRGQITLLLSFYCCFPLKMVCCDLRIAGYIFNQLPGIEAAVYTDRYCTFYSSFLGLYEATAVRCTFFRYLTLDRHQGTRLSFFFVLNIYTMRLTYVCFSFFCSVTFWISFLSSI